MNWDLIALAVVLFILLTGFRITRPYERDIVFRFGRFVDVRAPDLFSIIPLGIERRTVWPLS